MKALGTGPDIKTCDVLCIGGGGAAVTAAAAAAERGARVILVSKEPVGYGDTRISMGMIAEPLLSAGDSIELFVDDMVRCGEYLNNPALASLLAERGSRGREIIEGFGHLYQRDKEGRLGGDAVFFSGGHTKARTLRCPPSNGVGLGAALGTALMRTDTEILEETVAYSLLLDNGKAAGAVCYNLKRGTAIVINAKAVVLAAGGSGMMYYPHSDCSAGAYGDGYALAYEAGATLIDMEQIQFVPFGITHPAPMCGVFIGDPVMAEPAGKIKNVKGELLLDRIHTRTRGDISRVMSMALSRGEGNEHGGLWLDLTGNAAAENGAELWERRRRLGQLDGIRTAYGEKAYRMEEPWSIAPTAHYTMGGVETDNDTESAVPDLFIAGQNMGGVFGGDRLGSVSLTEVFVFGEIAGIKASEKANAIGAKTPEGCEEGTASLMGLRGRSGRFTPPALKRRIQKAMWEAAGLYRDEAGLKAVIKELESVKNDAEDILTSGHIIYNRTLLDAIELKHMLCSAFMTARSGLLRKETRGGHLRLDFPETDNREPVYNIIVNKTEEGMSVTKQKAKTADYIYEN